MGDFSISTVLDKLQGSTIDKRKDGLDDLKLILSQSSRNTRHSLGDTGFHKIFEELFRVVGLERSSFQKSNKKTVKNKSELRLGVYASALRLAVDAGATKIKHKTANAVLDHVVDTLPASNGTFLLSIRNDYIKSFRGLLQHPSHVEHLRPKQWQALVDFVISGLEQSSFEDDSASNGSVTRESSANPCSDSRLTIRPSQVSRGRSSRSEGLNHVDDLVLSLKLLSGATNAPLMSKAGPILNCSLNYLNTATRSQEACFQTMNCVLSTLLTEDVTLARSTICRAIPSIRQLWSTKSPSLRDELLTTLSSLKRLLDVSDATDAMLVDKTLLEDLFNTMFHEYGRRHEREGLQIEDILFPAAGQVLPLRLLTISPDAETPRAVANWACISLLATLVVALDARQNPTDINGHSDITPRKRRKVEGPISELLRQAHLAHGQDRLCTIQTLLFALDDSITMPNRLVEHISDIAGSINDEDASMANWSMLLVSRFAFTSAASHPTLLPIWSQIWSWSTRHLSSQNTCRSACHTVDSMLKAGVLGDRLTLHVIKEAFFPNGMNGPCTLTDTALSLWHTILSSTLLAAPDAFQFFSFKAITWLAVHWTLPLVLDRLQNAHIATHAREDSVYRLLIACVRNSITLKQPLEGIITSPIYRYYSSATETLSLSRYLLHVPGDDYPVRSSKGSSSGAPITTSLDSATRVRIEHTILELLSSKLRIFMEAWNVLRIERASNISLDIVQILASLCMISSAFTAASDGSNSVLVKEVSTRTETLWAQLCTFISSLEGDFRQRCLLTISSSFMSLRIDGQEQHNIIASQRSVLRAPLLNIMQQALEERLPNSEVEDDMMNIADSFAVHDSQSGIESDKTQNMRHTLSFPTDLKTAMVQMTTRILIEHDFASPKTGADTMATSAIVDFATSLSPGNLVATRVPLSAFFDDSPIMSRSDANRLLESLAETCLQNAEFERCEPALCFCVDILASLAWLWSTEEQDDLASTASDIYEWYLNVALGKGIATQRVLLSLARLLEAVLTSNASFGAEHALPSPRTSLLQIIKHGNYAVQYNIAELVSRIFDRFVLGEHDAVFNDVLDSLPSEPDHVEGIAVRLFVLAHLGSKWHTVLRRAIYHVFETAALIPRAVPYARECLIRVCRSLNIEGPQELFVLFSPQIIYTWLEKETLDTIPFQTFGFPTLRSLLFKVQDEVVGQIAMLSNSVHANSLAKLLDTTWEHALMESFVHAEAYCVARDISTPRDESFKGSEALIRKQLGADVYLRLVKERFPQIIARLFVITNSDQGIEKAFSKHRSMKGAELALLAICKQGSSTAVLPRGQQPSFRAKYLFDELDYLCQRIETEPTTMWEPAFVIHVCRTILGSTAPAFGPLNACSAVRKIRALVCLAGSQALKGYPLEMLLHTLRPFLTDFHSSEDALGLFWYLLDRGKVYLQSRLSFLTSLAVSTYTSLTTFLDSTQESTTQESHFRATMSKSQAFRDWLTKFLNNLIPAGNTAANVAKFREIVRLSASINNLGGNARGTCEGDLTYQLLADQLSCRPLLVDSAFFQITEKLCASFGMTNSLRDDILYEDADAIALAPILSKLLRKHNPSDAFKIWVAQVIGRAYASSGQVLEIGDKRAQRLVSSAPDNMQICSQVNILECLASLVRKDDPLVAGLAERSLQQIFTTLSSKEKSINFSSAIDNTLLNDLGWTRFACPDLHTHSNLQGKIETEIPASSECALEQWACDLAIALCGKTQSDPVLVSLHVILSAVPSLALQLLPAIVHIALLSESAGHQVIRQSVAECLNEVFNRGMKIARRHSRLALDILLYIRQQPLPRESTMADRNLWVEVHYVQAASAAYACGLDSTALLFLELYTSQQALQISRSSRRSSAIQLDEHANLVQNVFQHLDDPDFFFGVQEKVSLDAVMKKLGHENAGYKSLSFQSALYDSQLKSSVDPANSLQDSDIFGALTAANLHGLARAIQKQSANSETSRRSQDALQVSLNLNRWELYPQAPKREPAQLIIEAFSGLDTLPDKSSILLRLDNGLLGMTAALSKDIPSSKLAASTFSSVAVLTELRELLSVSSFDDFYAELQKQMARRQNETQENLDRISPVLVGREATVAAIKRSPVLQSIFKLSLPQAQLLEIIAIRHSLKVARDSDSAQFCLNRTMYLSKLVEAANSPTMLVDAAVLHDLAHTLWDQGEAAASIQILQQLKEHDNLSHQAIAVSRAEVLADLGHQVAQARLSKPDEIIAEYLLPAIKELHGQSEGVEAGRVFHNFAFFCDTQLQNADDMDELARVKRIRDIKERETSDMADMMRKTEGKQREIVRKHHGHAKQWFKLDDDEYRRLKGNREKFIAQSLENYLLSMRASDLYSNDTLRFVALWLDQSDNDFANAAVGKHLSTVPSRKFAPLMNQLSSRLLDNDDAFQGLLTTLLFRVCRDHPYHSLYQLFAVSKSKGAKNDEVASSRYAAAGKLADRIKEQNPPGPLWVSLHNSSIDFVKLANEKLLDKNTRSGAKLTLREIESGRKLEQGIQDTSVKIPPPTMKIGLRADCNYSSVPMLAKFDPYMSIAGGVSAPKIVTAIGTNGGRYRMLLKGGNDDLRQDSIMEQVFEQVSNLLTDHRATRQRKLGIRTYKVLPLTINAGIIEFVKDTIPLHEYLLPAHQRYFPKDFKPNRCRKEIADAQSKSLPQRIQAYRTVCANFRPVMRFFFMEHFLDPDEWFQKRLAYSRSTAAISILGHVLGLGDRHGHNILLDEKTGDVVHIDLGVAFEAGRILPVPETVPFRLTRDLVDGMGLSGVEGVFRRSCNFTLEALRQDQYSIMTILDVLRYDPLYSWSMTPLRLQKMQEAQDAVEPEVAISRGGAVTPEPKKNANEPSEADRALTTVVKKLGKSLSVEATVNELIQQATDEKNLATLYCGWAAYA